MEAVVLDVRQDAAQANRRIWVALTIAAILAGTAFRLGQFFSRQSFRADEVSLLLNIVGKTTHQLFSAHLEHGQAAPPLFLAAERFVSLTLGTGEFAERLIPLLLGLAALPLFATLAWRSLSPTGAALATAILCLSDKHIWFCAEVKQYTGDVLVTIVLMMLFCRAARQRSTSAVLMLSLIAAASIWFSFAAILVFAGLGAAQFMLLLSQGSWDALVGPIASSLPDFDPRGRGSGSTELIEVRRAAAFSKTAARQEPRPPFAFALKLRNAARGAMLCAPFIASFLLLELISLWHQGADTYLQDWWSGSFVDFSRPLLIVPWLLGRLRDLTSYPISPFGFLGVVLDPLILLGIAWLWRRRRLDLLVACLAPLCANVLAAAAHKYPFSGSRVNLFLAPGLLLLAGAGFAYITDTLSLTRPARVALVTSATAALLLGLPLYEGVRRLFVPRNKGQFRPVVAYLKNHREAGEPIYAVRNGIEFYWYWPDAPPPVYISKPVPDDPPPKFWLAFSYNADGQINRQIREQLDPIERKAHETGRRFTVRGGAAYEFATKPQ